MVSNNISHVCGTEGEFGNDYNTARNEALFDYHSSILNAEDGSDMESAYSLDSIITKVTSKFTNYISNLANISDTRTQDTSRS